MVNIVLLPNIKLLQIMSVTKIAFLFLLINIITAKVFCQITDYSNINNWAAHAAKWDVADSVPKPLRSNSITTPVANVFFIHPTTYLTPKAYEQQWNASVTDSALNSKTDNTSILFQASCFNQQSMVYAPRYRQAHIQAFFSGSTQAKAALDTAYSDVRAAFMYFVKYLNNDMPIIIAAHSQGTVHAGRLLKEFFENKPLANKLVIAYLLGMPVKKNYFATCKPCQTATETNCFVTWRTYLQQHDDSYINAEPKNGIWVTNPITWTLDTVLASRKLHSGSMLQKFNKLYKHTVTAQVHRTTLWISKPKIPFSFLVKNKLTNYHIGDINLFYNNIRQNLQLRLQQYLSDKK